MNEQKTAQSGARPHKRGKAPYGTPNHWTTWFVEQLAEHKTVNATLAATGITISRLYSRMAKDPEFAAAVEAARKHVTPVPQHFKATPR